MGVMGNNKFKTARKWLLRVVLTVVCAVVLIVVALGSYLATPLPAQQLSRILTSYLHQNFTVERVQTTGRTLYLRGVRLANPPGFPQGSLAEADTVAIAPQWGGLLLGRQDFRLIELDGIRIALDKNSKGVWNFGPLQQLFASKKKPTEPPTETRIKQLVIKSGAVTVHGQGVQGITLRVFDLATKGSLASRVDLAFEDAARNRFLLKGNARGGKDPALDLVLTAPALSLQALATRWKLQRPERFQGGRGSMQVNARLDKGVVAATGKFRFSHLSLSSAQGYPLAGDLAFAADYHLQRDAARLQSLVLTVDNLAKVHAQGTVQALRRERNFALDLGFDPVDLAALNALVPELARGNLVLGGRLGGEKLHVAGNAGQGVTSASGTLQLQDGALIRKGTLLVAGLSGNIGLSRLDAGILAKGRLSVSGGRGKALLESLAMPFELSFSRRLKPLRAEIPAFSAQYRGIPFSGRLGFNASQPNPITVSLAVPAARISTFNPQLERYGLHMAAGTAAVALNAAGSGLQQFGATARVQLGDLRGSRGKDSLALKKGALAATVRREAGHLLARGDAQLKAMALNGKGGDARFGYRISDRVAFLEDADITVAGAHVSIAKLKATIPVKESLAKLTRFPLALEFEGVSARLRELEVTALAGRASGHLATDPAGRWLDGTAQFAAGRVGWQGKSVAAPAVRVAFSRPGGRGELKGALLGGTLAGSFSFNPFAPEAGANFDLRLKNAELPAVAPFIPKGSGIAPAGGRLDLRCSGGYSRRDGISCRFESKGSGIALTGAGGKTLLSGAGLTLAGTLAGEKLSISEAVLSPGAGVGLRLKGEIAHALSAKRAGSVTFSLPETAVNTIVDPLINLLPRTIQEATLDGTVAAEGRIVLHEGEKLLTGSLLFQGGRIEVTAQKLLVSGLEGRFPFSLDLSRKTGGKPGGALNFSRENYPTLLKQLRRQAGGGEVLKVDKISFGALELGALTMHVAAANGLTEITSLNSSFSGGALLGKGFLTLGDGLNYRGDLLIDGLSLKQLCATFPGMEGYISGLVDGVISLSGGAKGLAGISGFTELWAREGAGEKMVVSKEFLQRLAKQKLSGFFFSTDRRYDVAEIKALLEQGDLSFETLRIVNTNLFGVRDLNVSIAPTQNRIALDHLLDSIKQATVRGKGGAGEGAPAEAPITQEFKWGE